MRRKFFNNFWENTFKNSWYFLDNNVIESNLSLRLRIFSISLKVMTFIWWSFLRARRARKATSIVKMSTWKVTMFWVNSKAKERFWDLNIFSETKIWKANDAMTIDWDVRKFELRIAMNKVSKSKRALLMCNQRISRTTNHWEKLVTYNVMSWCLSISSRRFKKQ